MPVKIHPTSSILPESRIFIHFNLYMSDNVIELEIRFSEDWGNFLIAGDFCERIEWADLSDLWR